MSNREKDNPETPAEQSATPKCGLVMPISEIDGLTESHWNDVRIILTDALLLAGYSARLVSSSEGVAIIQKNIVQNLYFDPIIVCDVSAKNPNVMFELGLRLAFDKPTVVVKDDKTSYSFDTSPIEHLTYPRDLRYNRIAEFKESLAEKVIATMKSSLKSDGHSSFLKAFGDFTLPKIETKEVSIQEFLIDQLSSMQKKIDALADRRAENQRTNSIRKRFNFKLGKLSGNERSNLLKDLSVIPGVKVMGMGMSKDSDEPYLLVEIEGEHSIKSKLVSDLIEVHIKRSVSNEKTLER